MFFYTIRLLFKHLYTPIIHKLAYITLKNIRLNKLNFTIIVSFKNNITKLATMAINVGRIYQLNFICILVVLISSVMLIKVFNIVLKYIETIYPVLPKCGTTKYINPMLITKSNMLQNITATCLFIPLKVASATLSIHIKTTSGQSTLKYFPHRFIVI